MRGCLSAGPVLLGSMGGWLGLWLGRGGGRLGGLSGQRQVKGQAAYFVISHDAAAPCCGMCPSDPILGPAEMHSLTRPTPLCRGIRTLAGGGSACCGGGEMLPCVCCFGDVLCIIGGAPCAGSCGGSCSGDCSGSCCAGRFSPGGRDVVV